MIEAGINRICDKDGQIFFLYIPGSVISEPKSSRILVSVHGFGSRKSDKKSIDRVKKITEIWSDFAEEKRWIVLAPHFSKIFFNNNYQRLNFLGNRADIHLNKLLDLTSDLLPGIVTEKMILFGFSGGGQFVHRYLAFHPERVKCAVAGAAGWYLWPDSNLPYPLGMTFDGFPKDLRPNLRAFFRSNLCIIVGERDSQQGAFRKSFRGYDLDVIQGSSRKARAKNWVDIMRKRATEQGFAPRITIKIVQHAAHRLNNRIIDCAEQFFRENT
jgi:pimeloyl-ACP methyl ester carboxylesterase